MSNFPVTQGMIFRHYKGNRYIVVRTAKDEPTLEDVVVYANMLGGVTWVRSLESWNSKVVVDGQEIPRFAYEATSKTKTVPFYVFLDGEMTKVIVQGSTERMSCGCLANSDMIMIEACEQLQKQGVVSPNQTIIAAPDGWCKAMEEDQHYGNGVVKLLPGDTMGFVWLSLP